MSKLFSEEALAHYGISGQKWGRRRWQYEDGKFNEEGKERYFGKGKRDIKNQMNNIKGSIDPYYATYISLLGLFAIGKAIEQNKLLSVRRLMKKNIKTLDRLSEPKKGEIYDKIQEIRKNEKYDEDIGLFVKNEETSVLEDMKNVNPYYSDDEPGTQMNCVLCSGTYILRRAGFDANAHFASVGMKLKNPNLDEFSNTLFKNNIVSSWSNKDKDFNLDSKTKFNKIVNQLKDGEASIINISFKFGGGGHFLNAEKINNKVYIIDSQSNEKYTLNQFNNFLEDNKAYVNTVTNINYKSINKNDLNKNIVNNICHTLF